MKLRKVVLLKEMSIVDVRKPEDRFEVGLASVFVAGEHYQLEQLDNRDVRITGNVGSVVKPWSSVDYVVEEPAEVKPVAKAGKR